MSNELIIDSLQRRMKALHSLYDQALSTMTLEHVNHFEREGVLPIAFSLFHITNMIDSSFMLITGQMPVWNDEWSKRVTPAINDQFIRHDYSFAASARISACSSILVGRLRISKVACTIFPVNGNGAT